ncbi:uncharacterized protein [Magallana gigas]|uniref:uncharacterized protein n=1 Tax=Magallana gigas TaxID=29159 RepID=UPI0033416AB4
MFQTSHYVFVTLFLEVFCKQRSVSYSVLDIEATNYPLTVSYPNFSILQCGTVCTEDSFCTEFLFNKTNKQCNAVHCVNKPGYSYQFLSSKNDQVLRFRKDLNWTYMGHYYYHVEKTATWEEAKLECQKLCSYLVEINSKEESDWLSASFFMKDNCDSNINLSCTAWTGGNDRSTEGGYLWDHSNTLISLLTGTPKNRTDEIVKTAFS